MKRSVYLLITIANLPIVLATIFECCASHCTVEISHPDPDHYNVTIFEQTSWHVAHSAVALLEKRELIEMYVLIPAEPVDIPSFVGNVSVFPFSPLAS